MTWPDCREEGQRLTLTFDVPSIFALTKAEDLWKYISRQLVQGVRCSTGLKFRSRFDWVTLRAKQISRGITVSLRDGNIWFGMDGLAFTHRRCTGYVEREMALVKRYLADSARIDAEALAAFKKTGEPPDTFKPCYVTVVPRVIRGRLRVFLHLTVEGGFAEEKPARSRQDMVAAKSALAGDKAHLQKMRARILYKIRLARKAALTGRCVLKKLDELNERYQDNKRRLNDIARDERRLIKQKN